MKAGKIWSLVVAKEDARIYKVEGLSTSYVVEKITFGSYGYKNNRKEYFSYEEALAAI